MIIKSEAVEEGCLRLFINGRIDNTTSSDLREYIGTVDGSIHRIIFDFRDVTYLSSAGIRELFICRKRFKEEDAMIIENISEDVFIVMKTVGFNNMCPISVMTTEEPTYVSMSFISFLEYKTARLKDRPFIVDADIPYSWMDIERGAQIIASDLERIGVSKGTHVGICGRNSIGWIQTFFAVRKLEAMALLINPGLSVSEIVTTAKISDMTYLCYGELNGVEDYPEFISKLGGPDSPIEEFYSFRDNNIISEREHEYDALKDRFRHNSEPDDPSIMIFTSGSTGNPKGVILSSFNILNAAYYNYHDQTLRSDDRTCLILPLFHIFGLVAGLFANAMADSTVYIPRDIRTDTLVELIPKYRITIFHSVPTMLIALMNNKSFRPEEFSSLRCTIISGSPATQSQTEMFKEKLPGNHFLASYGLSEMAPVSITDYEDTDEHVLKTVGKPVKNIQIKIVDPESGKECQTGKEGEILVQGYNLMVGYYNVPIENQAIDDTGWLHTGDLGYLNEEGYLCFTGRLKELIIRGGENIMPGEIESVLSRYDVINNVKVLGMPSEFFGEEVAACIMLKEGAVFDEDAIRSDLLLKLAKYKIPSKFLIFDDFPILGSGKIDAVTLRKQMLKKLDEMKG